MIRGKNAENLPGSAASYIRKVLRKTAYFIDNCNRHQTPLLFVQDVSGFMVGAEAEHSGIIQRGRKIRRSDGDGDSSENCSNT